MKVLIIDDNPDMSAIYANCCKGLEVSIEVIDSGLDALSYLEKIQVDAVLVDLAMPTFDGISCVQEIRRNEKMHPNKTPVRLAFFTAHIVDEVVEGVMREYGVEKVYQKPIEPFELIDQIAAWLGQKNKVIG